jgi:hypothetical protein
MSTIDANTKNIIERVARSNFNAPPTDRRAVELAFQRHFQALGLAMRPIRWLEGASKFLVVSPEARRQDQRSDFDWVVAVSAVGKTGRRASLAALRSADDYVEQIVAWKDRQLAAQVAVWRLDAPERAACDAAWTGARRAIAAEQTSANVGSHNMRPFVHHAINGVAEAAAWVNTLPLVDNAEVQRLTRTWLPMVDAWEAGLLLYTVSSQEIICVPRPVLSIVDNRLHREGGCAVAWLDGERYWFWRGVEVTRSTIETPEGLTLADIRGEANQECRRIMIQRMGMERFLRATRGTIIQTDECGKLWHCHVDNNDTYAIVEVKNGTPEPDGSCRRYFLRVPPAARTPRDAIAWTYGLTAAQYDVVVRT